MSETLNIKELSEYLKCSISEIRKLVRNRSIPFYRIGSKLYFKKGSVEKWILEKETNSIAESKTPVEPSIEIIRQIGG